MEAGASNVSSTLLAMRTYLGELAHVGTAVTESGHSDAA
jgi:hypothetical protein